MAASRSASVTMHMVKGSNNIDIADKITSFAYSDIAHGESDSLTVAVDNTDGTFLTSMQPVKGNATTAHILANNFSSDGSVASMFVGRMMIDSFGASGPAASAVTIGALSKPTKNGFSATQRTITYKNKTVKQILQKIAARAGISLSYQGKKITVKKIEQSGETDSEFAKKICEMYGLRIKTFNNKLVVYTASTYSKKKAVCSISVDEAAAGYDFSTDLLGLYTGATNSYTDKKSNKDKTVKVGKPKTVQVKDTYYQAKMLRDLTIRKKADGSSSKIGKLVKGKKIRIVKDLGNGWLKIAFTKSTKKKIEGTASGSAEKVISVERSQVGYHSYNSKYGPQPWCGYFQLWSFKKAGLISSIAGVGNKAYCPSYEAWAKAHGRWTHTPQPGYLVLFDWDGDGVADHIGLVIKVFSKSKVRTIEGNTHDYNHGWSAAVAVKTRSSNILGFVIPKYGKSTTTKTVAETVYGYIYKGKSGQNVKVSRVTKERTKKIERVLACDTAGYNKADAKRIARAAVELANESVTTMTLTIPGGNSKIVAAANVQLDATWGGLAGKWHVDQVDHTIESSSAYTEQLTLHLVSAGITASTKTYKSVGTVVQFKGGYAYVSAKGGKKTKFKKGKATILKVSKTTKYTYKIKYKDKKKTTVTGWVKADQIS